MVFIQQIDMSHHLDIFLSLLLWIINFETFLKTLLWLFYSIFFFPTKLFSWWWQPIQLRGKACLNKCPGYDTKLSDEEALVIQELWAMWSTPSLQSLRGLLWPGVEAPDRVLSMGQIELFLHLNWVQTNDLGLIINRIISIRNTWKCWSVWKRMN